MDWTGGCLCGAIRYRSSADPVWSSYCHCVMCRKFSGAPFAGFVQFPRQSFVWEHGAPKTFQSSPGIYRRFCGDCGSSLTFEAGEVLCLHQGGLDAPERMVSECHTYTSTRLPGMALGDGLPEYPGPIGGKGGLPLA